MLNIGLIGDNGTQKTAKHSSYKQMISTDVFEKKYIIVIYVWLHIIVIYVWLHIVADSILAICLQLFCQNRSKSCDTSFTSPYLELILLIMPPNSTTVCHSLPTLVLASSETPQNNQNLTTNYGESCY